MATLGQMSVFALIDSANSEAEGLKDFIEKIEGIGNEDRRWVNAFITSIRVRLEVANMKVIQGQRSKDSALAEAAKEAQALNE